MGPLDTILDAIGCTPLVELKKVGAETGCRFLVKCEFMNAGGSVKDRIGRRMVLEAEKAGRIKPGDTLIEPTSGNTGIALAFACAARGRKLILCMPESMSIERRKMLALLGARLELTDPAKGMRGAVARAEELAAEIADSVIPQQFENTANPAIHEATTAEEIWADTGGEIDVFISGVGTGGTLTGVGRVLKARAPHVRIVAVEPEDSPVLSGGEPGPHKIQGIGAGFVPGNLDRALIDEVLTIGNETAFETARKVAAIEGIPGGISSGAAIAAAIEIAERPEMAGKRIVAILPSFAERYLSTALFDGL